MNEKDGYGVKVTEFDNTLRLIRIVVIFVLCALIAALGPLTFLMLHNAELGGFVNAFQAAALLTSDSVDGSIRRKIEAGKMVDKLFGGAIQDGVGGSIPNFTFHNFKSIMVPLVDVADFRYIAFAPLITNITRSGWEAYATANVDLLNGPPSLATSINGSRTVSEGIFNQSQSGVKSRDSGYIEASIFPTLLFPVWQVTPIVQNAALVMLDTHALTFEGRTAIIDKALTTKKGVFTRFVQLVQDGTNVRPSTVIYTPILSLTDGSVVGVMLGGFSWDSMLSGILSTDYRQINCVISTASSTSTFILLDAKAVYLGEGDHHDAQYESYAKQLSTSLNGEYTITLYPTATLYRSHVTDTPTTICVIVVLMIAFTASLVMLYGLIQRNVEGKLMERIKLTFAEATARDAVLLAKKVYVRYMSHEMRTPLNIVHLGVKILEAELRKIGLFQNSDHTRTLKDITDACDTALVFLNDLLNFGKLEDGLLKIRPMKTRALEFFLVTTKMFLQQAEEKGVQIVFDIDDAGEREREGDGDSIPPLTSPSPSTFNGPSLSTPLPYSGTCPEPPSRDPWAPSDPLFPKSCSGPPAGLLSGPTTGPSTGPPTGTPSRQPFRECSGDSSAMEGEENMEGVECFEGVSLKYAPSPRFDFMDFDKINEREREEESKKERKEGKERAMAIGMNDDSDSEYLDDHDSVDIDTAKMGQVIRNIISNGIKFTPPGGVVIVRLRKISPRQNWSLKGSKSAQSMKSAQSEGKSEEMASTPLKEFLITNILRKRPLCSWGQQKQIVDIDLESCSRSDKLQSDTPLCKETRKGNEEKVFIDIPCRNSSRSNCFIPSNSPNLASAPREVVDYGMLVLSVADSGEGMTSKGCSSIYGDVGQFNPADLQPGSGSGLSSIISKGIVDLHGGSLTMHSKGPGLGCIFTLKIRLTAPASMDFDPTLDSSESRGVKSDPGSESRTIDLGRLPSNHSRISMDGISINPHHSPGKGGSGTRGENSGDSGDNPRSDGTHIGLTSSLLDSKPPRLLHLLVVDDSALNRRMIIKLLSSHKCDQAEDGVVAVQRVADRIQSCAESTAHNKSFDSKIDDQYHIENENKFGKFELGKLEEERKGGERDAGWEGTGGGNGETGGGRVDSAEDLSDGNVRCDSDGLHDAQYGRAQSHGDHTVHGVHWEDTRHNR